MADVTHELQQYLSNISILPEQEKKLRIAGTHLTETLLTYFHEIYGRYPAVRFLGSFDIGTVIRAADGECDRDLGVYLRGWSDDEEKWPSPVAVQKQLLNAVIRYMQTVPDHNVIFVRVVDACVRIFFRGKCHIDLPCFIQSDTKCRLSDSRSGWDVSESENIASWFTNQVWEKGEKLRDTVKILKGWAAWQNSKRGAITSSLILTVLAAENFVCRKRLDECVLETAKALSGRIANGIELYNPTAPDTILSHRLPDSVKKRFQDAAKQLVIDLEAAHREKDLTRSCDIWIDEFGGRFPKAIIN